MANKEIRELEIQVSTVGADSAQKNLQKIAKEEANLTRTIERESKKRSKILRAERKLQNRERNALQKRIRNYRGPSAKGAKLSANKSRLPHGADFDPYYGMDLSNYRSPSKGEIQRRINTRNFKKTGASGNWTGINQSNSAFASGAMTPAMKKVQREFSAMVRKNTGLRRSKVFGKSQFGPKDNTDKAVMSNLHAKALLMNSAYDKKAWKDAHAMNKAYDNKNWNSAHAMNKSYDSKAWSEAHSMNKAYDAKAWKDAHEMNRKYDAEKSEVLKAHIKGLKDNVAFDKKVLEEKKRKFNSIFKTGNRKFGEQMPHGTQKLLSGREKDYSDWWNTALGGQEAEKKATAKKNAAAVKAREAAAKKAAEFKSASRGKAYNGILELRNNLGSLGATVSQAVGELTMFAGAITMVGFMGVSAFQKLMAVGDAFAGAEKNVLTTEAFRNSLVRSGGYKAGVSFDEANLLNQKYSGMTSNQSGAQLARASTVIREMGGSVSGASMSNLVTAMHGAAAITGEDSEKMVGKVLEVAKKGKGADKLGLSELKLTKNIDENIAIIAKAIKDDPIAGAILKNGSVASAMAGIRNAPMRLGEKVYGAHRNQITGAFGRVASNLDSAMTDPEVVKNWSQSLTNLTDVMDRVLTKDRLKAAAIGASQWGAELAELAGKALEFSLWFAENSETVLKTLKWLGWAWGALQVIKFGVGTIKLVRDLGVLFEGIKGMVTTIESVGIGRIAKLAGVFGMFLANSKTVGEGEEEKLEEYKRLKLINEKDVYKELNLYKDDPSSNKAMAPGGFLNPAGGTVIYAQGNLTLGSEVSTTEQYMNANVGGI